MNVLNLEVDFMGQFFWGYLENLNLFSNFTALTCIYLELFLCAGPCQDMFRITLGPIWVTTIDTRFLKATDVWVDLLISIWISIHVTHTKWKQHGASQFLLSPCVSSFSPFASSSPLLPLSFFPHPLLSSLAVFWLFFPPLFFSLLSVSVLAGSTHIQTRLSLSTLAGSSFVIRLFV